MFGSAVDETKRQVRALVQEIKELTMADLAPHEFHPMFLERVVQAMGAIAGGIWFLDDQNTLQLVSQYNLNQTNMNEDQVQQEHGQILQTVWVRQQPALVPAGSETDQGKNLTETILLFCPLFAGEQVMGMIEVFQRPDVQPNAHQGLIEFLRQMSGMATDYYRRQEFSQLQNRSEIWNQLEQFSTAVHQSLDPSLTAHTLANEGRRLIDCDRVTILFQKGQRPETVAISGQETFERRSEVLRALEALTQTINRVGEPFLFDGTQLEDLPPQIEEALNEYLDESHAKYLSIRPLTRMNDPARSKKKSGENETTKEELPEIIGALVVEQFQQNQVDPGLAERTDAVVHHGSLALGNCLTYNRLFLLPIWEGIGNLKWLVAARTLPKTLLVVISLITLLLALCLVQTDLTMEASGKLEPRLQRNVFAHANGVVIDVLTEHNLPVKKGQKLVQLQDTELKLKLQTLYNEIQSNKKQYESTNATLLNDERLTDEEKTRYSRDLASLKTELNGLLAEYATLELQKNELEVLSPMDGVVTSWNVEETLTGQLVQPGDILLNVAKTEGEWVLYLQVPESRMGHVTEAWLAAQSQEQPESLLVDFVLATNTEFTFQGTIESISQILESNEDEGNTVRIAVKIDKEEIAQTVSTEVIRPGATVTAHVHCGRSSIAYQWLHEPLERLQLFIFRFL